MRLPTPNPEWRSNLADILGDSHRYTQDVVQFVKRANRQYWNWDELRRRPCPEGVNAEEVWGLVKLSRITQWRNLGLRDAKGQPYRFWLPDRALEDLHEIDKNLGGFVGATSPSLDVSDRDRYLINSLMEEAIASSQIEGAATTRKVAKKMLRTGRTPKTKSERMIFNNYRTILAIRELCKKSIKREHVFQIHEMITINTLEKEDSAGRFREPTDDIHICDVRDDTRLYTPPPADQLSSRLDSMIVFANKNETGDQFIHPVVRAILLHFWLAVDHPFTDGNGRTARALFYWLMLRRGYWLVEFMPISRIFLRAPVQYARAYLHAQHDDLDATYFVMYHLQVIRRALDELHEYLAGIIKEREAANRWTEIFGGLNNRQAEGLRDLAFQVSTATSIKEWKEKFGISYGTAHQDLTALASAGLISAQKQGRALQFRATGKTHRILNEHSENALKDNDAGAKY